MKKIASDVLSLTDTLKRAELVREDDILALSGYNMPLLLELFTNRDLEMEDLKEGLYEAFRESLVDLRAETAGLCEEEIEL